MRRQLVLSVLLTSLVCSLVYGDEREGRTVTTLTGSALTALGEPGATVRPSVSSVGVTSEGGVEGHALEKASDPCRVAPTSERGGRSWRLVASTPGSHEAGIKPGPSLVTPALIYGAASFADLASSHYAFSKGAREAWLPGDIHPWKALQLAVLVAADVELQRRGHKGKARLLRVVAVSVAVGLTVHNVNVARRQK